MINPQPQTLRTLNPQPSEPSTCRGPRPRAAGADGTLGLDRTHVDAARVGRVSKPAGFARYGRLSLAAEHEWTRTIVATRTH